MNIYTKHNWLSIPSSPFVTGYLTVTHLHYTSQSVGQYLHKLPSAMMLSWSCIYMNSSWSHTSQYEFQEVAITIWECVMSSG